MLLPFAASAQRSDSFFSGFEDDDYENRIAYIGLGNQPFGTEPAPVGSGLLVLTVAGAGYAALRRKRSDKSGKSHKTYMACVFALAMVLAFTGCKKKIEPIVNSGETAHITLNVGNGNRHIIEPNESGYVPVSYSAGDVIYVGNGSTYIGSLSCTTSSDEHGRGAVFEGDITTPVVDEKLHFYFVGGLTPSVTLEKDATTSFTVDISEQGEFLPVLSYGKVVYTGSNNINCQLENKCALVEFKMTQPQVQSHAVRIANMLSEAKIDFSNPGITPTGVLDAISLYPQSTINRWAILLPGDDRTSVAVVYSGYVAPGTNITAHKYFDISNIGSLSEGDYIYGTNAITIDNAGEETNKKFFVVSANGNVVQFSNGNLLYKHQPTPTWHIADNPWDFVGGYVHYQSNSQYYDDYFGTVYVGENRCSNSLIGESSYNGYIDLFGWSTWGDGGQPWQYLNNNNLYAWSTDFNGNIDNDNHTDWRILTKEEWDQLKTYHNTNKIGLATVHDVRGAILLPDNCSVEYYPSSWNTMSDGTWTNLVKDGAVFLPATGYRVEKTVYQANQVGTKTYGYYWTSSSNGSNGGYMYVTSSSKMNTNNNLGKSYGMAVRLVR